VGKQVGYVVSTVHCRFFPQQTIKNKDNAHDHENPDASYNVVTMLCCSTIGYFILKEIEHI